MTTLLNECEVILSRQDDEDGQKAELKRKARARLSVLSRFAKPACELAVQGTEGDPVRAYSLVCSINSLVDGVDSLHRLLRQVVPEADGSVKHLAAVKRGAFRNLSHDVQGCIDYTLPVSWACVPALRAVVQVLQELEELASDEAM